MADDVHAESLENLLASLRGGGSPSGATALAPMRALPALHRGEVIEIQGAAGTGKTHLLYHILLSVLAPAAPAEVAAVVYDTDASFDTGRFRRLLLARTSTAPDPLESVRRSLARLHVFRPSSSAQLAASIANLPAYHSSRMPDQEISVLAIDSISAFHWPDRFAAEQLRNMAPETLVPLHHVLSALQGVRRSHNPLVVLTNWTLASPPNNLRQRPRPFPDDCIAHLGAKVFTSTLHSPFRLADHTISLSHPPSDPPLTTDALLHGACHTTVDNRRACCLTGSSGARDAVPLALWVTDDDILVQPQSAYHSELQ